MKATARGLIDSEPESSDHLDVGEPASLTAQHFEAKPACVDPDIDSSGPSTSKDASSSKWKGKEKEVDPMPTPPTSPDLETRGGFAADPSSSSSNPGSSTQGNVGRPSSGHTQGHGNKGIATEKTTAGSGTQIEATNVQAGLPGPVPAHPFCGFPASAAGFMNDCRQIPCHHQVLCHHHHIYCHGCSHSAEIAPSRAGRTRADSSNSSRSRSSSQSKRVQFASPEVSSSGSAVEGYDRSSVPPNFEPYDPYDEESDDEQQTHDGSYLRTSAGPSRIPASSTFERRPPTPSQFGNDWPGVSSSSSSGDPWEESSSSARYGFSGIPPASTFDSPPPVGMYGFSGIPPASTFDDSLPSAYAFSTFESDSLPRMLTPEEIDLLFKTESTRPSESRRQDSRSQDPGPSGSGSSHAQRGSSSNPRRQSRGFTEEHHAPASHDHAGYTTHSYNYGNHNDTNNMYNSNRDEFGHSNYGSFQQAPASVWDTDPEEARRRAESEARLMAASAASNASSRARHSGDSRAPYGGTDSFNSRTHSGSSGSGYHSTPGVDSSYYAEFDNFDNFGSPPAATYHHHREDGPAHQVPDQTHYTPSFVWAHHPRGPFM